VRLGAGDAAPYLVRGASFGVTRGQVVGVVGESGSGKSMSILALLGLLPRGARTEGAASFRDRDLLADGAREAKRLRGGAIGVVFQDPLSSLNPVMTIGYQLRDVLKRQLDLKGRAADDRACELLDLVGIPNARRRLGDYPHQFSGGMRQRVLIAAAIAAEPALLIADEPTTALDVTVQAQVLELLARLKDELDMSILLVSHDFGVIAGFTDETVVMYAGEVIETGTTLQVMRAPNHPYTRALLACVPRLDRAARSRPIPGVPLDARTKLPGCRFRPRCPNAFDRCVDHPPLFGENGRQAACWLLEDQRA
jgi:oligopeptide/dipeptide ABC transporter ATP-binding protein